MDYALPGVIRVESDGPVRIVRLARPEQLNAVNEELHLALTRLFPMLSADPRRARRRHHRRGARVLGRRRLRSARPDGEGPRAAARRDRGGSRARAEHDPLPDPRGGRRQRAGRGPRLQRDRALGRRLHGRVRLPRGPARGGGPRGGRRRPAHLAAAHEPAAREGVRVHGRPDQRGARGGRSASRITSARTARCSPRRSPPPTRSLRCRVRPWRRPSAC